MKGEKFTIVRLYNGHRRDMHRSCTKAIQTEWNSSRSRVLQKERKVIRLRNKNYHYFGRHVPLLLIYVLHGAATAAQTHLWRSATAAAAAMANIKIYFIPISSFFHVIS